MLATEMKAWLDRNEPASDEDAMDLHLAVRDRSSCGDYRVETEGAQTMIEVDEADQLVLASDAELAEFRGLVDDHCPDPERGWEGGEAYRRGMSKDD